MNDLTYIREELKKFEKHIDNEQEIDHLGSALSCINDILDNSNDEHERKIAFNIMRTHRNEVIKEARTLLCYENLESEELSHIINVMEVFVVNGFGDEPEFHGLKEELSSRRTDEFMLKIKGKYLKDFNENDKLWLKDLISNLRR